MTLRFLCELAMLAALAYWGFTVGDGAGAWVLGVGAPLLAAVVWARKWAWLTIHSRLLAVARTATADVGRVGGRLGQS